MTNLGYTAEEPVAAIATALAPGAIGIVRMSGRGCIELLAPLFSRPEALRRASGNSLVYGWIIDPRTHGRLDEVMVGVYRAPRSFTGEDMAEIFCHGGIAVVTGILSLLLRSGFRQAERGEFTFRSYINGKSDLTKAEAVREIIESRTGRGRERAAGRLAGTLAAEIAAVRQDVVDALAAMEVGIEYPEDEETIADSFDAHRLDAAKSRLSVLIDSWESERLYQDGARVVLCGMTNAGKSSLFNALLKEDRAIVSAAEGTTRDWLEGQADFSGIPVRLFDTAGLRDARDAVEAAGVARAKDLSREADVILYVVDARKGLSAGDAAFLRGHGEVPVVLAWNKTDAPDALPVPAQGGWRAGVAVSAATGAGIRGIITAVTGALSGGGLRKECAGLGSLRQKEAVAEALERLEHGLSVCRGEGGAYALDAAVQDLEDCLDSLGEVTGAVTPDDVLSSIFSRFCVGK